ncbi:MAG: ABC transporter permease [Alphaproteobacteria bacterium]
MPADTQLSPPAGLPTPAAGRLPAVDAPARPAAENRFLGRRISPLNARRLRNFRRNRRGTWSLWIFLVLFVVALAAELVANDKPLVVSYDGNWYFPVFQAVPETEYGGFFETEAEYRDREVQALINEKGWMLWPLIPYSYDTFDYQLPSPAPSPPDVLVACSWYLGWVELPELELPEICISPDGNHLLGTDDSGRDVVARIIYGFRISVLFGLLLTGGSVVIAIFIGALQGYFGGMTDLIGQRIIEIWGGMPVFFLLLILASIVPPGFFTILILLLLFSWVGLQGLVRAEFLRARNFDYVRAARALGVGHFTIMFRHVLPNAMVATLTFLPFTLTAGITALTALDFLGYGLPPGSASLGELLGQGKANLQAPWLAFTAFFVLAIMLSLLIFIGEAIRDAFDPRKVGL